MLDDTWIEQLYASPARQQYYAEYGGIQGEDEKPSPAWQETETEKP